MFNPNNLVLHPSHAVSGWLWLPHLAALGLLWSCSAPLWLKGLASLSILAAGVYTDLLHARLKLPYSPHSLWIDARKPGICQLRLRNQQVLETRILGNSIITARFVVLRVRPVGARRSRVILVCCWNSDPDAFRRLRVILRFQPRSADKALAPE